MERIFIDCGHNSSICDIGSTGFGLKEHDVTYSVGVLLAEKLKEVGFNVQLSHANSWEVLGTTTTSSLNERVDKARMFNANYYISLHTDGDGSPSAKGAHIRLYDFTSPAAPLAETIINEMLATLPLQGRAEILKEDTSLYVLRKTKMPALLIEMGFITNKENADLMRTPEKLADAIFLGICKHFKVNPNPEIVLVSDIVNRLSKLGIISDKELWLTKLSEDTNAYWLARKTINYILKKGV